MEPPWEASAVYALALTLAWAWDFAGLWTILEDFARPIETLGKQESLKNKGK
jgi:hypothetical protein